MIKIESVISVVMKGIETVVISVVNAAQLLMISGLFLGFYCWYILQLTFVMWFHSLTTCVDICCYGVCLITDTSLLTSS